MSQLVKKRVLVVVFLVLALSILDATQAHAKHSYHSQIVYVQSHWWKTELYLGTDIKGQAVVTEDDWNIFLKDEVTPRFPDGLTVLEGYGQYRDASGEIVRERSKVLVILYPANKRKSSSRKIEEIRKSYKAKFKQESVLRVDHTVKVSF